MNLTKFDHLTNSQLELVQSLMFDPVQVMWPVPVDGQFRLYDVVHEEIVMFDESDVRTLVEAGLLDGRTFTLTDACHRMADEEDSEQNASQHTR